MSNFIDHKTVFKQLSSNFSTFQESLHKPEDKKKETDTKEDIASDFISEYYKSAWYYKFEEKCSQEINDNVIAYKINTTPHRLLYTDIVQKIPSIVCQQGYTACWTKNPGTNIIVDAKFVIDDETIQNLYQEVIDNHNHTMIDQDKKISLNINIGNVSALIDKNSILPEYITSYTLPWFYSKTSHNYFPLYFTGDLNKIQHKFTIRRSISDLLQVYDIDGNRVDFDKNTIKSVNGKAVTGPDMEMPFIPELWASYAYMTDMECEYNKTNCYKTMAVDKDIFIEDYKIERSKNPSKLDNFVTIGIKNSKHPVISLGIMAQNLNALQKKNYSNYTTNSESEMLGYSPIDTITFCASAEAPIFKNIPSYRLSRVSTYREFNSIPLEPGIFRTHLGVKQNITYSSPGVVINDGTVEVSLKDMNPYLKSDKTQNESTDSFTVIVIMVCLKKLSFVEYPDSEDKRSTAKAKISITDR